MIRDNIDNSCQAERKGNVERHTVVDRRSREQLLEEVTRIVQKKKEEERLNGEEKI